MKYTLISVEELNSAGVPRIKFIDGQLYDGKPFNQKMPVQTHTRPRFENPIGTLFEGEGVTIEHTQSGKAYYKVSSLTVK